jgi:hypothetical protein
MPLEPIDALTRVLLKTTEPQKVIDGMAKLGFVIADQDEVFTPGEHLLLLKRMRRRIAEEVENPETPARDLASLSRRLQDVSREITSIEEKLSAEKRTSGSSNTNGAPKASRSRKAGFDPTQV